MGLFEFIRDVGERLGIGSAEAAPPSTALIDLLKRLGLPVEGLSVDVAGDTVKVSGSAASQELKEKIILALGNAHGVAKVEETIATPAGDSAEFYTVKAGDTLSAIAKKTRGNANEYMKIFEANKPMLSDPNKIYPGQVLRVPKS
ncbi:MAG: peptidoglycan-binding protein LysM [Rhodospirillales bacterium]|jgi:nucleoid-associated protein YgaU|nr:peptidoglycan-binding protein LysM [Rhodospirillales bacterium]